MGNNASRISGSGIAPGFAEPHENHAGGRSTRELPEASVRGAPARLAGLQPRARGSSRLAPPRHGASLQPEHRTGDAAQRFFNIAEMVQSTARHLPPVATLALASTSRFTRFALASERELVTLLINELPSDIRGLRPRELANKITGMTMAFANRPQGSADAAMRALSDRLTEVCVAQRRQPQLGELIEAVAALPGHLREAPFEALGQQIATMSALSLPQSLHHWMRAVKPGPDTESLPMVFQGTALRAVLPHVATLSPALKDAALAALGQAITFLSPTEHARGEAFSNWLALARTVPTPSPLLNDFIRAGEEAGPVHGLPNAAELAVRRGDDALEVAARHGLPGFRAALLMRDAHSDA